MKLDRPYKALLWEELVVGGTIFLLLLTVVIFVLVFGGYTPDPYGNYGGPRFITYLALTVEEIEYTSFVLVGILSLLLILNIGNTGEMLMGFPSRILRYPVPTKMPVGITLYCRLFIVLLFAFLTRFLMAGMFWERVVNESFVDASFRYFYELKVHFIPFSVSLFLHGVIYLFLQIMAWLFGLSPLHFITVTLYLVLFLCMGLVGYTFWGGNVIVGIPRMIEIKMAFENLVSVMSVFSVPLLILFSLIAFYLGVKIANATRHRKREVRFSALYFLISVVTRKIPRFSPKSISSFSSPYLAQLWYELRKTGFAIPLWTLIVWSLSFGFFYFLYNISYFLRVEYILPSVASFITRNFGLGLFLLLPYLSFWIGCGVWALMNTRRFFREMKTQRFDFYWYPILKIERFNVYWFVLGINLLLGMILIWIIQFGFVYIVYSDFWQPEFQESINRIFPEISLKVKMFSFWTLVSYITALTVINGLLIWVLLSNTRTVLFMILLPLFLFSLVMFAVTLFVWLNYVFSEVTGYKGIEEWISKKSEPFLTKLEEWEELLSNKISPKVESFWNYLLENHTELYLMMERIPYYLNLPLTKIPREDYFLYLVICFFFTGIYLLSYILVVYNRLVRVRDATILLLIFIITFFCLFPWRTVGVLHPGLTLGTYLFLASVMNLFWVRTYLHISGVRLFKKVTLPENVANMKEGSTTKHLVFAHLFNVLCVVLVPFLRINPEFAKEISKELLISRSLPTSLDQINHMYCSVSERENLADYYVSLFKKFEYEFYVRDKGGSEWFFEFCKEELKLSEEECSEIYRGITPSVGDSLIPKYEPISAIAWKVINAYHERIWKEFADELKEISKMGISNARYPIDLRLGLEVPLPHLSRIREMARILMVDALINCMNENYTEMIKAYRASLFLIDSLKNEPLIISQLVRHSVIIAILDNIIWCINHKELPESVLKEICEILRTLRISVEGFNEIYELASAFEILSGFKIVHSPVNYWGILISQLEEHGIRGFSKIDTVSTRTSNSEIEKTWIPMFDIVNVRSFETVTLLNFISMSLDYQHEAFKYGTTLVPEVEKLENFFNLISAENPSIAVLSPLARLVAPVYLSKWIGSVLRSAAFIDMVFYIIEIDLFVRQNKRLPENLEIIESPYVTRVPIDPFDKYPNRIKYRKFEDGSCVIYSVFINKVDDGGNVQDGYNTRLDYGWKLLSIDKRRSFSFPSDEAPPLIKSIREGKKK